VLDFDHRLISGVLRIRAGEAQRVGLRVVARHDDGIVHYNLSYSSRAITLSAPA
jgi:hypothetical protein